MSLLTYSLLKILFSDKRSSFGIILLSVFILMGVFAPLIAPIDPFTVDKPNMPFSWIHPFGTDPLGRDVWSQLIWGCRMSMLVAVCSALGIIGIGLIIGLCAALSRSIIDNILMRFTDIILYIPKLPLLIFLALILGRGFVNIVIVLSLTMWPQTARIIRAEVLSIKQRPFVDSARVVGAGTIQIIRLILPHILPLILASFVIQTMWAIIYEASIGFLGLGDPSVMSWGTMFYYAFTSGALYLSNYAPIVAPGACIAFIGIGLQNIAFVLQEMANPKLREARRWRLH